MRLPWRRAEPFLEGSRLVLEIIVIFTLLSGLGIIGYMFDIWNTYINTMSGTPYFVKYTWPALILIVLLLFIFMTFAITQYRAFVRRIQAHRQIADICRDLAADVATSNQAFFDLYFSATSVRNKSQLRDTAIHLLKRNLNDALNRIAQIFQAYTGGQCAVCLKCILVSDLDIMDWRVETVLRDTTSQAKRSQFNPIQVVRDNSAYIKIIKERAPYFKENDLKDDPTYINNRNKWNDDFNATLVYPFPVLRKHNPPNQGHPMALLCIDNQEGGFDNTFSICYVEALSWQISALWYLISEVQLLSPPNQEGP